MPKLVGTVYGGPFVVDFSLLSGALVDVVDGGTARARRERPGIDQVTHALATSVPAAGAAAGIPPAAYAGFLDCNDKLAKIRPALAAARKAVEVLEESEAMYEHDRENFMSQMSDAVRSTAQRTGDPAVKAPFDVLLVYVAQSAEKGQKTRQQNEAAKKAAAAEGAAAPEAPGGTMPPKTP